MQSRNAKIKPTPIIHQVSLTSVMAFSKKFRALMNIIILLLASWISFSFNFFPSVVVTTVLSSDFSSELPPTSGIHLPNNWKHESKIKIKGEWPSELLFVFSKARYVSEVTEWYQLFKLMYQKWAYFVQFLTTFFLLNEKKWAVLLLDFFPKNNFINKKVGNRNKTKKLLKSWYQKNTLHNQKTN